MTTYFISDLHLGHKLVSENRGFADTEEHDRAVMASLTRANGEDVLWMLGDVTCTGDPEKIEAALALLRTHPARKHLVAGNHDPVHAMHVSAYKWLPLYEEVFESVQPFGRFRVPGNDQGARRRSVLLSHFPYTGDSHGADRFDQYRLADLGMPLVHGHTHSAEKLSWTQIGTLQINVCWEAWRRPVAHEEIVRLMDDHG